MPIVVEDKTEADYQSWLASQKSESQEKVQAARSDAAKEFTLSELMAKGEAVYNANCAACHQANGEGIPGNFPAIKGSPVALGPIAEHLKIVAKGKGAMMPGFSSSLSKVEIAAVVTYQRNGFGNDKGDLLQPSQVSSED
jgi:cytochrome c oxidase subunit 2